MSVAFFISELISLILKTIFYAGPIIFVYWTLGSRISGTSDSNFFVFISIFVLIIWTLFVFGIPSLSTITAVLIVNGLVALIIFCIWLFFYFFSRTIIFFYSNRESKIVQTKNEYFQDTVVMTNYDKYEDLKQSDSILKFSTFYPFPDTGQRKCYDNESEIICPQPYNSFFGQDAQNPRFPRSYTKIGYNGKELSKGAKHQYYGGSWIMTRDNITGLIWSIIPAATCKKRMFPQHRINNDFISSLNNQSFGGYADWRMPTIKEVSSLINSNIYDSGSSTDRFWFPHIVSAYYWSSTIYDSISNPSTAYLVDFSRGSVGISNVLNKNLSLAVRCTHNKEYDLVKDNKDGTVTDPNMGLMWQYEDLPKQLYSWAESLEYASKAQIAGYSDWRLPTRNELHSIVYYPVENINIFGPMYFWSSTTYAKNPKYVWMVDDNGKSNFTDKIESGDIYSYVRLVRSTIEFNNNDPGV